MPRWGHKHTLETRLKLRQIALAGNYRPPNRKIGFRHSKETRAKMSASHRNKGYRWTPERRTKFMHSMEKVWKSPEHREKMRQARLKQHFPAKMTSIEVTLYQQFRKRRLKFEMHKSMFGRWQPDFVFESVRLIVQADGDYWHRQRPSQRAKDHRFDEMAHADGWTVWRFAETEIEMHPEACGRAVARFVKSH